MPDRGTGSPAVGSTTPNARRGSDNGCPIGNRSAAHRQIAVGLSRQNLHGQEFALTRRVLLLSASNGVGLDLALGITSFEATTIERSSLHEFGPGFVFPTCSAEDLLVHKCFAGRDRDLADAEQVVVRNRKTLDLNYIRYWLKKLGLAIEDSEIPNRFERLLLRVNRLHEFDSTE